MPSVRDRAPASRNLQPQAGASGEKIVMIPVQKCLFPDETRAPKEEGGWAKLGLNQVPDPLMWNSPDTQ